MSGYGMARDKKYRTRRLSEMRREQRGPATTGGGANVAGWKQLARLTAQAGLPVQQGGDRFVQ